MDSTMPGMRIFIMSIVALACTLSLAGTSTAHPTGVSDMPELADEPSDPVLVHRALESSGIEWYPGYTTAAEGCVDYRIDEWDAEGKPTHLAPVFAGCATDRISMYEHSAGCANPYAQYCIEQVITSGYIRRLGGYAPYAVLYRHGEPEPARQLFLERMVLGVESWFRPYAVQRTESIGEIGSVRVRDTARSKYAYRWGVVNEAGTKVYTTVPAVTRVMPTIKSVDVSDRTLQRKQRFVTKITTDVPIWGTARVEYRFGTRWIQISRADLAGKKSFSIPGRIHRSSGVFPMRVRIDGMSIAGRPWYDPVSLRTGKLMVVSTWAVKR